MKQRILAFLAVLLLVPGLAQARIFLVDTDDTLRVVTASGVSTIHMYAAWADLTTTALTPGASDAQVTTATTTVLVAAPSASTQRQIKGLSIRNAHASSSNVITVQFFDGAAATELIQYTLLAGETLQWGEDENFRVIDASGQVKGAVTANAGTNLNTSALLTTSAHDAAFGTAGTADAQVRSVQGIASMTPLLVNPGTATNYGVYAEDTAHASGDNLVLAGVVQQAATAALAADGDRTLLQVDANGHLKVVNQNPNLAADNSTLSTAKVPVLPGTVSTSAPTWTTGNQSALSLQTDGSVRAAITNTPTVTANAGTNLNTSTLLTTTAHDAAFGTAGTADAQVRTVQGIASMTPLQVQSNSANLATAALQDGIIKDGTGDTTQANVTSGNLNVNCVVGCSGGATTPTDNFANPTTAGLTFGFNAWWDGATWDRAPGNATDGLLVNLGANNDVTVTSGSITANAGTNLNTSALALESGGNLATIAGVVDATASTVPANALVVGGTDGTNTRMLKTDTGGELQVDVLTLPSVTIGTFPDNEPFNIAQMNGVAVTMGAGNTGTGVQRVIEATDSQLSAGVGATGDAAATVGSTGSLTAKLRLMTSQLDAIQTAVQLIDDDQTGASVHYRTSAGATEDEHEVKGSAGRLFSITATNTNAAARYLRCSNQVIGSTTPGTTTVFLGLAIPGATTGAGFTTNFGPTGIAFSTGLTCWLVTGAADTDVAEVAANEIKVIYSYK